MRITAVLKWPRIFLLALRGQYIGGRVCVKPLVIGQEGELDKFSYM